uniref:Uncharacterized protein n=1 Tax=Anguilla anguilla TaxID=7936 RepID=A0A0E9VJV6_ANGAN
MFCYLHKSYSCLGMH